MSTTPLVASSDGAAPDARETAALSRAAFLTIYLPAVVLATGTGIALPAIPILAKSFNVTFGLASFVVTVYLLGGMVGSIPTGWLIDRFGRRPILIAGPLLTAAMAFMVFTAQTFPELLAYRFLDGWAAQMWILARLAGIAHRASAGQRGRQVSWMFGMDGVGRLSGPLVGGFIAAAWGERAPFAAYSLLALLALVPMLLWMPEDAAPKRRDGDAKLAEPRVPIREIILPRLAFFGIAFFSAAARGPIFADMLHLYAAFAYNLSAAGIGLLATAASAVSLPIGFLAGWMMDRFGRKVTMVPGFFGVALTMVMLSFTAFLHLSLFWYVGVFLLAVCAQGLTSGSVQTVGTDVAPANARGTFLGLWRFTGQVGTTLSPMAFAYIADVLGYGSSFVFVGLAGLVTAILLVTMVPETGRTTAKA